VVILGALLICRLIDYPPPPMHSANILGVNHRESLKTIRAAYIKLLKDLAGANAPIDAWAHEQAIQINGAYQDLKAYHRARRAMRLDVSLTDVLVFWVRLRRALARVERERPAIETPPCMRLDRFARFFFRKRTYERYLAPCIAETQEEYLEALREGDERKARWVRIRGVIAFWWTVLKRLPIVRQLSIG
jgi:hypothetical protein